MKIPLKVNGSFCEYRESHFHGGIDLSTQKITGHDIQAVAAGTLYRVKNIIHGEGKALYIRHQSGDISVYAHLESFSPKIQDYLDSKVLSKTYDIFPSKMIQFLEGEVIGYSGESGAGFPHLHFEMRSSISKSEKRSMYLSGITDNIPPVIRDVFLVPYKSKKPIISLKSNHILHGKYGIALKLDDRMDGSYSKCSVYKLKLLDNGNEIYNARFETIHYGKSPNTQMHFVGSHTHLSPTQYVYKMYKDFDKPSSYIENIVEDGILGVGDHKLEIEVEDFFGNIAKKTVHLKVASHKISSIDRADLSEYQGDFSLIQSLRSVQNIRAEIESYSSKELGQDRIEIIKVSPSYVFFMKKAQLIYRSSNTDKLYLSRWDPFVKKWKSLSTKTYHRFVSSDIRSTGIYSVKKDLYAPFLGEEINRYKGLRLAFDYIKVNDVESGVDRNSISLTCNDKSSDLDYDSDRNWIILTSKITNCLQSKIEVCDKVGNCTERRY
ncbi:MAG: M23 family metallopeptidase [Candidatus Cloacimonetes bacterium]|nr:M23 family metallopeptidase [Candidatus Cloacimonadota bacterium]